MTERNGPLIYRDKPGMLGRQQIRRVGREPSTRFTWELAPAGGDALVVGFDVAVLADGRIAKVYGFLDKVPAGV